jgi:hypothetical protein
VLNGPRAVASVIPFGLSLAEHWIPRRCDGPTSEARDPGGAAAAAVAVLRHGRHATRGHNVAGGILVGDVVLYDTMSRLLLGPLVKRIAADAATVTPDGARVLEVGCGPGHLSIQLARHHGWR